MRRSIRNVRTTGALQCSKAEYTEDRDSEAYAQCQRSNLSNTYMCHFISDTHSRALPTSGLLSITQTQMQMRKLFAMLEN